MAEETVRPAGFTPSMGMAPNAAAPARLSWGAVFGGVFVALGVWVLLYTLGLAIGLSAINPQDPSGVRAAGIGTGIWSLISPLIALFCGGYVAARVAGLIDRTSAGIHGVIVWALTTVVGLILISAALSSIIGGVVGIGQQAVSGAAKQAQQGGGLPLGISSQDLLAPVNKRLQAEGKPTITPQQFEQATRGVLQDAVRTGNLNRQTLVRNIEQETRLSRADAEDVANRVQQQFQQGGQQLQTGALKAADVTGKAFWGVFAALFLGLVSSVLGAITGLSRKQRYAADRSAIVPPTTGREVRP